MLRFRYPDKPTDAGNETFFDRSPAELAQFISQRKYDGWRMPTYIQSANLCQCFSRDNKMMQSAYRGAFPSEITPSFLSLGVPDETVFDTEFVGPRGSHDPAVYIFDMLAWAGKWLTNEPFEVRWQRCLDLLPRLNGRLRLAETLYPTVNDTTNVIVGEFEQLKREWIESGNGMNFLYEGLVVKRRSGKLILSPLSCQRSLVMTKWKFRDIGDRRF